MDLKHLINEARKKAAKKSTNALSLDVDSKPKFLFLKREFIHSKDKDYGSLDSVCAKIIKRSYGITANFTVKTFDRSVDLFDVYSTDNIGDKLPALKKVHALLGQFINKLEKIK